MIKNKERKTVLFKFHRDNKGSAMAMVIVIIAFISVLAAVLMFASYLGYQMRLMDKQGKDVFYSAETVLDEINAGLQAEVSDAMAAAYEDVMVNYAIYNSADLRSSHFNETYISKLKTAIQGTTEEGCYDVAKLRTYLSQDIIGNSSGTVEDGDGGSREKFGSHGAIVESLMNSSLDSDKGILYMQTAESLLLKDLKVSYVDERGNVSMITTDIKIILPDISFAQPSELPALEDACLIADVKLAVDEGSATIQGNAYAGEMTVGSAVLDANGKVTSVLSNGQLHFANRPGADAGSTSLVVSTKDVTVYGGSTFETRDTELWSENILLKSAPAAGNSATVDLAGSTNLNDDLVLEGTGSRMILTGEYNGFGMNLSSGNINESGGANDDSTNPALSSAIVVNGKDSRLDFSGLSNLTIAGHTYVQTKVPSIADGSGDISDQYKNKANVLMGESVALKSNQLIYLAPGEALGCKIEDDGTIGDSAYGVNPLTLEQYEEIINNPDKYVLLNGDKSIAALDYQPLSNFIQKEQVQGQADKQYMPEVIFNRTNSSTLVYCYLRFRNEEYANQYFQTYYKTNAAQVSQYTRLYAKEIKMWDPDAITYLNLAGNMLVYTEGQAEAELISAPGDGKSSLTAKQNQAKNIFNTKSNNFKALSAKMVKDVARLTAVEQGRTAFVNIIDEDKVTAALNANPIGGDTLESVYTAPDGAQSSVVLTSKDVYTVDGVGTPDSGIIISLGSVDVKKNFNGLILAKENITVTPGAAGVTISALGIDDFSSLFDLKIDGTETYVLDVFRGGINYKASFESGAGVSSGTATEKVVSSDLIRYERWTKR